jgi:hypothetical protein
MNIYRRYGIRGTTALAVCLLLSTQFGRADWFKCVGRRTILVTQCGSDCSGGCTLTEPPPGTTCDTCYTEAFTCTRSTWATVLGNLYGMPCADFGKYVGCVCWDVQKVWMRAITMTCYTCTGFPCLLPHSD